MNALDKPKPPTRWLALTCVALSGLAIYLLVLCVYKSDHLYIRLNQAGLGVLAALAEIVGYVGPVPELIAGVLGALLLAAWFRWKRRWLLWTGLTAVVLLVGGIAWLVWTMSSRPTKFKMEWVDSEREEPEGATYQTFHSKSINEPVSYLIYLPEDYASSPQKHYPVVYCLPGGSGKQTVVAGFLRRLKLARKARPLPPMIVVGVNGNIHNDGPDAPIERVIVNDLIPHIDQAYRTIPRRDARALQGGSHGGFGVLYLGMKYPERFGVITCFAPALKNWGSDNPWNTVERNTDQIRAKTHIRLVCGTEDPYFRRTTAYHALLNGLKIEHDFVAVKGAGHPDLGEKIDDAVALGLFERAFKNLGSPAQKE